MQPNRIVGGLTPTVLTCYEKHMKIERQNPFDTIARLEEGGAETTNLRVYMKKTVDGLPVVQWKWAKNSDGSREKIPGFWYNDRIWAWMNMFYTTLAPSIIRQIAQRTVEQYYKDWEFFYYRVANNRKSLDSEVWSYGPNVKHLVTFGDSLSDTGVMWNASLGMVPNSASWAGGHFTNGRVWSEFVEERSGMSLNNWAVGGSGVKKEHYFIYGLMEQVRSFLDYVSKDPHVDKNKIIATIWIGANDFLSYGTPVKEMVGRVQGALLKLWQSDIKNIIVFNMLDITVTPLYRLDSAKKQKKKVTQERIDGFNNGLSEILDGWAKSSPTVTLFDNYKIFNERINDYRRYKIDNIDDSTLDLTKTDAGSYIRSAWPVRPESKGKTYAFWDQVHPTERIHELLAEEVLKFINEKYSAVVG